MPVCRNDTLAFFSPLIRPGSLPAVISVLADNRVPCARMASEARRSRTEAVAQLERDNLSALPHRPPGAAGVLSNAQ